MKRTPAALTAATLAVAVGIPAMSMLLPPATPTPPSWEVRYSPRGGCTDLAVAAIGEAGESVLLMGYGFTSAPIATALIDAHGRGVRVEVLLDESNLTANGSQARACQRAGIPVWIDGKHAIAHNKVLIIDGKIVLTGSFNWTKAAEQSNAENLLLVRDPALAKRYADNWQFHRAHAEPLP